MKRLVLFLLLVLSGQMGLYAQNSKNSAQHISIEAPKISHTVRVDGNLEDSEWSKATKITAFTEFFPEENGKPEVNTEAYLMYDEQNLYIAFKAFDDPSRIRYSITDRDNIFKDDFVGIMVDTYGNTTWGYEIFVNPVGIQADLKRTSNREDAAFDIIFYSAGKIVEDGYVVEMAIPFKSLRFPDRGQQKWLIALLRMRPRESRYQYLFPAFDRNNPCMFCQAAELTGISGIKPGRNIELIPAITANQSSSMADYNNPDEGLNDGDVMGQLSLSSKIVFNSNMSAEITINPDFSQVESDAAQIDVNTTFALFYPERRPFFQEGSDIFDSYFDLIYTRSINDPIAAAKFTARRSKWDIAYLGARDEHSPILIPLEESTAFVGNGKSLSNIMRIKRSFGKDSYWGILLSDRRYDGGWNSVMSFDLRYLFFKNYRIKFQYFKTFTKEIVDSSSIDIYGDAVFSTDSNTIALDGEKFSGHGIYSSLEYESRHSSISLDYWESSPYVRADNGFLFQNNYRKAFIFGNLQFYPRKYGIDMVVPNVMIARVWNLQDVRKDEWFSPGVFMKLKGQTDLQIRYLVSRERFSGKDFPGIRRINFRVNSRFSDKINLGMRGELGRSIARTLSDPVLGKMKEFSIWADIKLFNRFFIEPNVKYFNMKYPDRNENIYDGYILRVRSQYQFNKELYARLILQYDKFNRELSIEPLITYQLNPFTIFYIGATSKQMDFSEPYGFRTTSRQIFLKFQYLWRV
jgi:hypothetical protein